jgi:hypothetical protein
MINYQKMWKFLLFLIIFLTFIHFLIFQSRIFFFCVRVVLMLEKSYLLEKAKPVIFLNKKCLKILLNANRFVDKVFLFQSASKISKMICIRGTMYNDRP